MPEHYGPDDDELTPAQKGARTRKINADNAIALRRLIKNFEHFENKDALEWADHRLEARDYYDNIQFTQEEREIIEGRKEPVVTDNIFKDKIDAMLGLEIEARTDVRALPRNPEDEAGTDAATEAIKFVEDNTDLDHRFSEVGENEWIEGTGFAAMLLKNAATGELEARRYHPDQCYWNASSRELDFSDNDTFGIKTWWDVDALRAKYPGPKNAKAITDTCNHQTRHGDPEVLRWWDGHKKLLRVMQTYYKTYDGGEPVWHHATWTYGGFLQEDGDDAPESPGPSKYLDDEGNTNHPHVWQSTYINRKGRRYGLFDRLKDLQDEINKRRSKGLHYLNTNQVLIEEDFLSENMTMKQLSDEVKKPDGMIKLRRGALAEGRFQINRNTELASGNLEMMADTRNRMSMTGPGEGLSGQGSSTSGRHLQTQQQGELIPLTLPLDRHQSMKRRMYRKTWWFIKNFWPEGRWVRVTDSDQGTVKFTPVNMSRDAMAQTDRGREMIEQFTQRREPVPEVFNKIRDMDFDMILDEVPDIAALQQEQFAGLLSLAQAGLLYPKEIYLEASSLPNKTRLKKRLKELEDAQAEANQAQGQIQQAQMEQMQAEIAELAASAGLKKSQAAKADAETAETQAETELKQVETAAKVRELIAPQPDTSGGTV